MADPHKLRLHNYDIRQFYHDRAVAVLGAAHPNVSSDPVQLACHRAMLRIGDHVVLQTGAGLQPPRPVRSSARSWCAVIARVRVELSGLLCVGEQDCAVCCAVGRHSATTHRLTSLVSSRSAKSTCAKVRAHRKLLLRDHARSSAVSTDNLEEAITYFSQALSFTERIHGHHPLVGKLVRARLLLPSNLCSTLYLSPDFLSRSSVLDDRQQAR